MADPYVYSKFELRAEIITQSGKVSFDDVVSISATFGLNGIPTASLNVAVGYDARSNGTKKATIHDAKKKLRPRDKVTVTLKISPTAGDTEKMEAGEFVIFDGLLAGIGYQRSSNSANYTLHLIHWLDELNNSSAINGNWFPNAPYDLAYNASCYSLRRAEGTTTSGDDGQPRPTMDPDGKIISQKNASEDMWGSVIKPLFQRIANYKLPKDGPNTAALDALDRIPGNGKRFSTPLALDLSGLPDAHMTDSLRTALTKDALESFAYTSFWGKIIGDYASQFFFALSPGVGHALAIPFFGGLRWQEGKATTIKADEYSYANFNAHMTQLLESVLVYWPWKMGGNYETGLEVETADEFVQPLGSWPQVTDGKDRPGLKLFKEPPGWIVNLASWAGFSGASTSVKGKAGGDSLAPGTGEVTAPEGWFTPAAIARDTQKSGVASRFAHHWYKTELLAQRYGELSGKLRFDIAPGSIVRIEMPIKEIGSDGYMVAAVSQVSYSINAERALAGTSFALSYIRTIEEDGDDKVSADSAPLYKNGTAWYGGPLKTPTNP
jgi:hypothetical protein